MNEQQELEALRRDAEAQRRRERDRVMLLAQLQAGTHVEEGVPLFAHCGNILTCTDAQVPVIGTRTWTSRTYADNGADDGPNAHAIETSWYTLAFAKPEDATCKRCGGFMHLSDQERPIYAPISGHDQKGLVKIAQKLITAGVKPTPEAIYQASKPQEPDRVKQLEDQVADLKALIASRFEDASPANVEASPASVGGSGGPRGYRERNGRYEALIYASESEDGRQHGAGTFDTVEEALAAREAWLA